jgi:hypothetical protein
VVRQEHSDREVEGFAYNQIARSPLGAAPGSGDEVEPHFEVAGFESWIAADDTHPVILETLQANGRRHAVLILDQWGEPVARITERTFGSTRFCKFALCKPGSAVRLRADTARIDLHSAKARLLGQVELKGDAAGVALQKFRLQAQGAPSIAPPPDVPAFSDIRLVGAELFEFAEELMVSALDVSSHAAEMQQQVRASADYAASGLKARQEVDRLLRGTVIPHFLEFASAGSAPARDGWAGYYWRRAAANLAACRAASRTGAADNVAYLVAGHDARAVNGPRAKAM